MKIAGVVVLYNPDKDCINNIKTYVDKVNKLYIVDNSDVTINYIWDKNREIDSVEYISLGQNKGLAYALNIAVKKAIEEKYDWLLTMDQDSKFLNDIIGIYKRYIKNNDCSSVALLSPQYETERNTPVNNYDVDEVYWTMQSANLINLSLVEPLRMFEEKYFIDCIDYEYCLKAKKAGYNILRINEAVLKHSPAVNKKIGRLNYGYTSPLRVYYQTRNAMDMWKRYHSFRALGIVIVKFGKSVLLFDNKRKYVKAIFQGITDCNHNKFGKKEL